MKTHEQKQALSTVACTIPTYNHVSPCHSCILLLLMMRRLLAERLARWIRAYDLQDCQMRRTHMSLAVKVIPGKTLLPCSEETIADELAETGLPFTCTFAETLCLQYWCGPVAIRSLNEDLICPKTCLHTFVQSTPGTLVGNLPQAIVQHPT